MPLPLSGVTSWIFSHQLALTSCRRLSRGQVKQSPGKVQRFAFSHAAHSGRFQEFCAHLKPPSVFSLETFQHASGVTWWKYKSEPFVESVSDSAPEARVARWNQKYKDHHEYFYLGPKTGIRLFRWISHEQGKRTLSSESRWNPPVHEHVNVGTRSRTSLFDPDVWHQSNKKKRKLSIPQTSRFPSDFSLINWVFTT